MGSIPIAKFMKSPGHCGQIVVSDLTRRFSPRHGFNFVSCDMGRSMPEFILVTHKLQ